MPRRRSIAPENQVEQMLKDMKQSAKANNTKSSGSKHISSGNTIAVENEDGTQTIIGGNGLQEFVGDTTIPPVPAQPTAVASLGVVTVTWSGTFVDSSAVVPVNWSHIEVQNNGVKVGDIRSATRGSASFPCPVGSTAVVTLVAVNKAGNRSEPSPATSITVEGVDVDTSQLEADLDALDERLAAAETGDVDASRLTVTAPADFKEVFVQNLVGRTADIQTARVDNLLASNGEMDTLAAGQISSSILNVGVETPDGGLNGVRFDNTGISATDATGEETVRIGSDGSAFFKGTIAAGSFVSKDSVEGLTNLEGKLNNWASSTDSTIIDGSKIATGSISADKISIGENVNMIPNGLGQAHGGWEAFNYNTDISQFSGLTEGVEGTFYLTGTKTVFSEFFNVAGLTDFSISYWFQNDTTNATHQTTLQFYDIDNVLVGSVSTSTPVTGDPGLGMRWRLSGQTAPSGALKARIRVDHNPSGVTGTTHFTDFILLTGNKMMLNSSGITAYNGSTQTVRINGVDNLLIGDFISGRPGFDPHAKLSATDRIAKIEFFPSPQGAANNGIIWYNEGDPTDGLDWGQLHFFALNNSPTTGLPRYAAGIRATANGDMEFTGYLSPDSQTFKAATITFPNSIPAGSSLQGEVVYAKPYPSYVSFDQIAIQLTAVSGLPDGKGADLNAVVTFRANTGFKYQIFNRSNFSSGATRLNWNTTRIP